MNLEDGLLLQLLDDTHKELAEFSGWDAQAVYVPETGVWDLITSDVCYSQALP